MVVLAVAFIFVAAGNMWAGEVEVLGVKFPTEKVIEGKTLKLNGVSYLKRFGTIKVYAVGLYMETPSNDFKTVIESEQVKHLFTHFLTSKATAEKLRKGFIKTTKKNNPKDLVDMKPGQTSETVYVPGKGLTLTYQGMVRGTIPGSTFAQMYYRNNVGKNTNKKIREGLLGL
ncbi:MAG: chalcone isomerase family protein [Deltaproteobacteria bacterium]|nr:chalcone isomerase family protein [Deltaproteobacteria bacterium]